MSGCGTGVTGVAIPAGVSWDAGTAGQLAWGGQPIGKGALGTQVPGKGKGAFGTPMPGKGKGAFGTPMPGKGKGAFGTFPGKGFGALPGKGLDTAPGKGLGVFPGKGAQKPVWQPVPGGGKAKRYPPGQAGIPYAWHPGYGIVQ